MSTVHLSFSPDPAYVRTVRLVAAAVARRAGVADELLDEVRLAIGEACTRAVALHRRHDLTDLIDVAMSDGGRFTVRVTDRGPVELGRGQNPGETTTRHHGAGRREPGGRAAVDEDMFTAGVVWPCSPGWSPTWRDGRAGWQRHRGPDVVAGHAAARCRRITDNGVRSNLTANSGPAM